MMQKLDNLIQEIIEFGNTISYNTNLEDINVQNACNLFNNYLSWQFNELKEELKTQGSELEIKLVTNELNKLCSLIKHNELATEPQFNWFQNLLQYCTDTQQNKAVVI
ncbi:MAG: hypothetical protein OEZ38_01920 [Gammaproteobacteria bacterium]|nr:hypothetical protein [Gammaproteobacteria bacterium]